MQQVNFEKFIFMLFPAPAVLFLPLPTKMRHRQSLRRSGNFSAFMKRPLQSTQCNLPQDNRFYQSDNVPDFDLHHRQRLTEPCLSHTNRTDRERRIGDALELIRLLPASARGYVFLKAGASRGLFAKSARYWMELRSHIVVLSRGGPNSGVSALFSVLGCQVSTGGTSRSPILRLRKIKNDRAPRISVSSSYAISLRFENASDAQLWQDALTAACEQRVVGVSDFEFVSPIGRGASGKVFLVRDRASGRKLALKVIDKAKVFQNLSAFSHAVHERLALQLVAGHPFFTRLRYAFQTRSNFYLAIDFYEGGDLYQYLRTHSGRLAEPQARIVCSEVALALDHLHRLGFVYRDLKPENVLLDPQGHIRLADFGLCKLLPADRLTATVCGTHTYAAPEMLSSQPYGISVDLWAFGTFLYHVLRGRTPYEARDLDQVIANMNNKRIRFSSNTSPELVHLIKQLLDWNPDTRFGCGNEGMNEVRRHPFFKSVDWRSIYNREPNSDGLLHFNNYKEMRSAPSPKLAFEKRSGNREPDTSAGDSPSASPGGCDPSSESVETAELDIQGLASAGAGLTSSSGSGDMEEEGLRYRARPRIVVPEKSTVKNIRLGATSLWDGMVAAAESNDLRNFDMVEWGKVSVDHDEDDAAYGDYGLWPLLGVGEALADERMIAGFAYSSTNLQEQPNHL